MSIKKNHVPDDNDSGKGQHNTDAPGQPELEVVEPAEPALDSQDAASAEEQPPAIDRDELFRQLVDRANHGDKESLKGLRILLDRHPEIWQRAGDLADVAERAWIEFIGESNKLVTESIHRMLAHLKASLAGERPTPLERLLVDHAAITWLAAQGGEIQAAEGSGSVAQAALRIKRAESGQRRFLAAVKTLTTLRALVPHGMVPIQHLQVHQPKKALA